MADTETKVLEVNIKKAETELQKYKRQIDDLKGSLLGLERGSEEYNKKLEELRKTQTHYNEVMRDAKSATDAVEGSYDYLQQQMTKLKREWRATADAAERAKLGDQIRGLNDELKQLDASVGDYKRNVGDYRNAWADVFNSALGPLRQVGGRLGDLARQVKSLQPLIKQVNTTAVSGLKGITRAIASTGIGLLVLAVGELAAHWEDVTNWIKNAVIAQDDYNRALKDTETRLNALILKNAEYSKDWDAVDRQRKILFEGYTEVTFAQERLNKALDAQEKAIKENEKATKEWKDAWDEVNEAEKEIKAATTDGELFQANRRHTKAQQNAIQATVNYGLAQKNLQVINEGVTVSIQNLANAKKAEENTTKSNTNAHKEAKSVYDGERQAVDDLIRRIEAYRRAIGEGTTWQLEDDFSRDKALLDKALADGVIDTEKHAKALKDLTWMFNRERVKILHQMNKDLLTETTDEYNKVIAQQGENLSNALKNLDFERRLKDHLKKFDPKKSFKETIADSFNNIFGDQKTINKVFDKRAAAINEDFALEKATSEQKIELYKEQIEWWDELQKDEYERQAKDSSYVAYDYTKQEEYLEIKKALDEEEINLDNLKTQNFLDNADLEDEREEELLKARQARWQLMGTAISATSNIMKQFASMQEQQIKDDVANGKISEREGNKKFKRVKALQKAAAVMETAQAAMGAYSSLASIPYVGPALGIAAAAAAVAQGLMQIKQIDKTTLSSSSSSNLSTSTPDMNSVTNTYEPTYVTNMQTNTELSELANVVGSIQPVVKVTDINDAQNTVKVRDEENSF